jgi:hypothetical protein
LVVNGQKFNLSDVFDATNVSSLFFKENDGVYSYQFAQAGRYTIGFGVVDVEDFSVTSALQLSGFQYKAIPTPALLPGLVGLGLGLLRKRKSDAAAQ